MCVGKTLNMDSCSKYWGNLEGIWGNPGEIPHIGWKIPGVYRVKLQLLAKLCMKQANEVTIIMQFNKETEIKRDKINH